MRSREEETVRRGVIAKRLDLALGTRLREFGCHVFGPETAVRVSDRGRLLSPTMSVVAGMPRFDTSPQNALTNPCVIIEVISWSAEHNNGGEGFAAYRDIESLTDYTLIVEGERCVHHYVRRSVEEWSVRRHDKLHSILEFASVDGRIPLSEIYRDVDFDTEAILAPAHAAG